jgi:excisionase family DNA binding protein
MGEKRVRMAGNSRIRGAKVFTKASQIAALIAGSIMQIELNRGRRRFGSCDTPGCRRRPVDAGSRLAEQRRTDSALCLRSTSLLRSGASPSSTNNSDSSERLCTRMMRVAATPAFLNFCGSASICGSQHALCVVSEQAAKYGGIGRTKLYQLIKDGVIAAREVGRRTIVLRSDLEAFLASLPIAGRAA